jgi:hypothetical protein
MDNLNAHGFVTAEQRAMLMETYRHPLIEQFGELGREMGHGGMDYIMDARLVYCLQNGLPLDMDVYDMAEWCCLAELGSLSMDNNCASVAFPDFTRGHWNEVEGYRHVYSETEAATLARAKAYTEAQKSVTQERGLWALYGAVVEARQKGDAKEKSFAVLRTAVVDRELGVTLNMYSRKYKVELTSELVDYMEDMGLKYTLS